MTQRGVLIFLLTCALLGGASYGLFEPYHETVKGPLKGAAARNPYLAVARMLEAMGLPVTQQSHIEDLAALPPTDATLLLLGRRTYVTERRSAELSAWVKRGGHLVVQAWVLPDTEELHPDPLLDALGVSLEFKAKSESKDEDKDKSEAEDAGKEEDEGKDSRKDAPTRKREETDAELARWSPEPGVTMRIRFNPYYALALDEESELEPAQVWSDDKGVHGYSLPLGNGHVTVWSDDGFLQNDGINRWDHAELAYRLVRMFEASGNTWIVTGDAVRPSFLGLVLEYAWSVCIALGVWLIVYLWSIAPRFGPIEPDPTLERRELMEHVRASGGFLLRNAGFDTLVSAVRSAIVRRIQQRHAQWLLLDARARVERVAEHTGLAAREIEDALESASSTQRDTLVKRIATLEAIRRRL